MNSVRPGRGSDQFPLRLPDGMRDRIRAEADKHGRSMNAEIVELLERALSDTGPSKTELGEVIDRQNQYIIGQKEAITSLLETAEFQKQTIEKMSRRFQNDSNLSTQILRHVLGYIDSIPASLTVWADHTLRILDVDTDLPRDEEEDVILHPNSPENRERFGQMLKGARARQEAYEDETVARIRARLQEQTSDD